MSLRIPDDIISLSPSEPRRSSDSKRDSLGSLHKQLDHDGNVPSILTTSKLQAYRKPKRTLNYSYSPKNSHKSV